MTPKIEKKNIRISERKQSSNCDTQKAKKKTIPQKPQLKYFLTF